MELDLINKKLTSEIENLKDLIKSRDEEIKVLLGIIEKYKAMEENFKKVFKKDLDPNKRLVDRIEEEDRQLSEIRSNVYGDIVNFEQVKFNKNENLMSAIDSCKNLNKSFKINDDSKNSSFSNANTKSTGADTNTISASLKQNTNLLNSFSTHNNSLINNFLNSNTVKNKENQNYVDNSIKKNNNNNNQNYNPIPISLLKEINTANSYLLKPFEITKDVISNDLKLYDIFKNGYIKFPLKDEEQKKSYLKEIFQSGQVLANEYKKLREMTNSIKNNVKLK